MQFSLLLQVDAGSIDLGFFLDYAHTPVKGRVLDRTIRLSEYQLVGILLAGYGINDSLQIGIAMPYLLGQDGVRIDTVSGISSKELGDIEISAKYRLTERKGGQPGFALSPFFILETGSEKDWFGNQSNSVGISLIADKQ